MATYFNGTLKNLIWRLRKYRLILDEELRSEILEHSDVIIDMIVNEQLYEQGINGMGVEIMSYRPYTRTTVKIKHKKGQPFNRVTLRDKGDFYNSLHVKFDDNGFYVTSTDEKAPELLAKYGTTVLRLTDENLSILLDKYIKPALRERFKHYIMNG
jgi:hypothetical protein